MYVLLIGVTSYSGHIRQRPNSLENTLMLGNMEGKRKGGQAAGKWIDSIIETMSTMLEELKDQVIICNDWMAHN